MQRLRVKATSGPWWASGLLVLLGFASGCGLLASKSGSSDVPEAKADRKVSVEMPWETTAVRDNEHAPVLDVRLYGDAVAVPYLYGYPIYPDGEAAQGLVALRRDNAEGASREQAEDEHGVVHRTEHIPMLGCTAEGVEESPAEFVPTLLRCELPAPKELGGDDRPVIGEVRAGASAEQLLRDASLRKAFFGDWHLVEGNLKSKGEGFFNTQYGQLAFGFERGRLASVTYYFDPPEKRWRSPMMWSGL